MIDRQTHERAKSFQDENDCFIHVEMKDGGVCEVLLVGTGKAVLYGFVCAIQQFATFAESSFGDAVDAMQSLQKVCNMEEIGLKDEIKWGRKE